MERGIIAPETGVRSRSRGTFLVPPIPPDISKSCEAQTPEDFKRLVKNNTKYELIFNLRKAFERFRIVIPSLEVLPPTASNAVRDIRAGRITIIGPERATCTIDVRDKVFISLDISTSPQDVGVIQNEFGWKIHVSCPDTVEDISKYWDVVRDVVIENSIATSKVVNAPKVLSLEQAGKQITIYCHGNPNLQWDAIIDEISRRLLKEYNDAIPESPVVSGDFRLNKNGMVFYLRDDSCSKQKDLEPLIKDKAISDDYKVAIVRIVAFNLKRTMPQDVCKLLNITPVELNSIIENPKDAKDVVFRCFGTAQTVLNTLPDVLYIDAFSAEIFGGVNTYNPFNHPQLPSLGSLVARTMDIATKLRQQERQEQEQQADAETYRSPATGFGGNS